MAVFSWKTKGADMIRQSIVLLLSLGLRSREAKG